MIVSAIADPSIFGPTSVSDELTVRELVAFLTGIVQNGVLLSDPDRQMLRDAITQASLLSRQQGGTKKAQRILLLLQEIIKQHKRFVVCCARSVWTAAQPTTVVQKIMLLHMHLKSDVIVTTEAQRSTIAQSVTSTAEVIEPSETSLSQYESTRLRVATPRKPLDDLTLDEIDELIGRSLKYASVVRLFDYRMVARARRTDRYRDGIQFVIGIWMRWCVIGDPSSRSVELFTVGNTQTQDGYLTAADANARLENDIVEPLKATNTCHVIGHVKDDGRGIFHARGFEARKRAYTIDPGFDGLGPTGPVRRCLLTPDPAAEWHFEECRNLQTI